MIVDDDPDVRRTLTAILATDPDLTVTAQAHDGREAIATADTGQIDVILLDIRMPNLDGLATLEALRRTGMHPRVIMLTTFGEAEYVRRAIAGGADGFLLKAGDPHDLLRAIHGTVAGESSLSPAIAGYVAEDTRRQAAQLQHAAEVATLLRTLTPRELDVAQHVANGLSNADIARQLHLSESTVKAYLSMALARLGLRNRVELAALVWRANAAEH